MKLNVGCGFDKKEGYVNIDKYDTSADRQMSVDKLEYEDNSVEEIFSSHVLEHNSRYEIPKILKEWNRVLQVGGRLNLLIPNLEWVFRNWLSKPENERWGFYLDTVFGLETNEGEFHKTGFTKDRIRKLLISAGFEIEKIEDKWSHEQWCIWVLAHKIEEGKDEVFILDCYPHDEKRMVQLREQIAILKEQHLPIVLATHYKEIPNDIISEVDYVAYDKRNPKSEHWDVRWVFQKPKTVKIVYTNQSGLTYHSVAIYNSLKNAVNMISEKFKFAHFIEYDIDLDLSKYLQKVRNHRKDGKRFVGLPDPAGTYGTNTGVFSFDVEWMKSMLVEIPDWATYEKFDPVKDGNISLFFEVWLYNYLKKNSGETPFMLSREETAEFLRAYNKYSLEEGKVHFVLSETAEHQLILFVMNWSGIQKEYEFTFQDYHQKGILGPHDTCWICKDKKIGSTVHVKGDYFEKTWVVDDKEIYSGSFLFYDNNLPNCVRWDDRNTGNFKEIKKPMVVIGHGSYIGHTGYNEHTRNFFRELDKYIPVKVHNFSHIPDQNYLDELDHKILMEQRWGEPPWKAGSPSTFTDKQEVVDVVLAETNHFFFYDDYSNRRKIAYNVWESTLYPDSFFRKLLEFDQLWVPSTWARDCAVKQGFPADRVKVVPEGVDGTIFNPSSILHLDSVEEEYKDGRFKFLLFGRWDNRKSTTEIVQTFLKTFDKDDPVDLIVSIDNPFPEKWQKGRTTEQCLKEIGADDPRIHVKHFPPFWEYVAYLKKGHVFVSCARSEGWNLPLIQAIACGIPTICSNYGAQLDFAKDVSRLVRIKGMEPIKEMFLHDVPPPGEFAEPDFNHLSSIMKKVYKDYNSYKKRAEEKAYEIIEKFSWENAAKAAYENLKSLPPKVEDVKSIMVNYNFVKSPFVEVTGNSDKDFKIKFIDKKVGREIYGMVVKSNNWVRAYRQWFTDWKIEVESEGKTFFTHDLDLKSKRVLISFDSKSLGDTIAWFPYVEEFRKKHDCKVIASTFLNKFFKEGYPEIEFVAPGTRVDDIYAQYSISYQFEHDPNVWPVNPKTLPLQAVAASILGLDFEEIKPKIKVLKEEELGIQFQKDMEKIRSSCKTGKYVCISEHSTAQCKYWNYDGGWQRVINYLKDLGYTTLVISTEPSYLKNTWKRNGMPIEKTINYLKQSEMFIGVGSGLAWLSWAIDVPTIMISGCSDKYVEFKGSDKNVRLINEDVCHGCFNDVDYAFDRGKWDWCPTGKNFECSRSITPEMVFAGINKILGVES